MSFLKETDGNLLSHAASVVKEEGPIRKTVFSQILPENVASSEQFGTLSGTLLMGEEEIVGVRAVPKRMSEFAAGRTCARQAIKALGISEAPILADLKRQPLWPDELVGSITHCDGYCAAAVAYKSEYVSIGIDVEKNEPLPYQTIGLIAFGSELEWLNRAPRSPICWDRLLFSIKETVYKVWYPITKSWLDFEEARIAIDPDTMTFLGSVLVKPALHQASDLLPFRGSYTLKDSYILTSLCAPRKG